MRHPLLSLFNQLQFSNVELPLVQLESAGEGDGVDQVRIQRCEGIIGA